MFVALTGPHDPQRIKWSLTPGPVYSNIDECSAHSETENRRSAGGFLSGERNSVPTTRGRKLWAKHFNPQASQRPAKDLRPRRHWRWASAGRWLKADRDMSTSWSWGQLVMIRLLCAGVGWNSAGEGAPSSDGGPGQRPAVGAARKESYGARNGPFLEDHRILS